jgi:cytochrome c biogenesis protein CcmG/thiol:disulfide interchange protein DsbE
VMNLWASWCGPCREELPSFEALSARAGGRLRVLGVASEDGTGQAAAFAGDAGIHFPSVVDETGRLLRAVGRRGLPVTLFVDRAGHVVDVYNGEPLTSADLRRKIRERLGVDVD